MVRRLLSTFIPVLLLGAGLLYAQAADIQAYLERGRKLSKAEKYEQALPYYLLALELGEKEFGGKSSSVVPLLNDLGEIYSTRRDFGDAEPLFLRSLDIQEREIKRYRAGIARTLNNLGSIYEATDRPAAARKLYQRVLADWRPALGPGHPSVTAAKARLAKLPAPKVAAAVPAAPKPPRDGFSVHISSIRDGARAGEEWGRLKGLHPGLLAGQGLLVVRIDLGAGRGVWYRVHAGPQEGPPARALCAGLARRGTWCQVVRHDGLAVPAREPRVAARDGKVLPLPPAGQGGYRIHLTSIRDEARAGEEWARLVGLYRELLEGLGLAVRRADLGAGRGVWYRIQGGPLTRESARARCNRFKAREVWCGVVPPRGDTADWLQRQVAQRSLPRGVGRTRGTRRPSRRAKRRRRDLSQPEPGTRRFAERA
jgi:tetratricopeptide (TPR) repeat protein